MVPGMAKRMPGRPSSSSTLLTLLLLAIVLLLAIHGIVMGVTHFPDAGCATCIVAILAALLVLLVVPARTRPVLIATPRVSGGARVQSDLRALGSRHPPKIGPVLRL